MDLMDLDSNDVMEIVVFNGKTGKTTYIMDRSQIVNIVDNLNDVRIKLIRTVFDFGYKFC